jgi:hypothetical protein
MKHSLQVTEALDTFPLWCSVHYTSGDFIRGTRWRICLRHRATSRGFDSQWCHWNFSLIEYFHLHYGPGVDSASDINECQEYFLGVEAAGG